MITLQANPSRSDIEDLARNLRERDAMELLRLGVAQSAKDIPSALERSCDVSIMSVLAKYRGRPAALYGLQLILPLGWGIPWLMTTHVVEEAPLTYTKLSKAVIDGFFGYAHTLIQWVDEEYVQAWRWLEGPLGFHRFGSHDFIAQAKWPFRAYRKLAPSARRTR